MPQRVNFLHDILGPQTGSDKGSKSDAKKYSDEAFLVGLELDLIICIALTSFSNNYLN